MVRSNHFATLWLAGIFLFVFMLQRLVPLDLAWVVGSTHINFFLAMIAHGSIAHLLGNLFALVVFGGMTEGIIGTKRYLYVLLIAGVVGNLAGIGSYTRVIGASGAIYGAIGLLAVLRPRMVVWAAGLPMPMLLAAIGWAVVDILGLFANTSTGHLAHLAGIIVGAAFGFSLRRAFPERRKPKKRTDKSLDRALDRWEDHFMTGR